MRGERSLPVLAEIRERLEAWSVELLPKNPVAQAVAYALGHWAALTRHVEDGRLSIDNNVSERTLRMAAVGRNYAKLSIVARTGCSSAARPVDTVRR